MSKTAIIILVYGDSDSAIALVNSVKDKNILEEIVLVDNCSPDSSYEKLKTLESGHIHVIKTQVNDGIAKGNNFGAAYAKKICPDVDYYLFSNPDVITSAESIADMIEFLDKNPDVGAVCPMELTKEKEYARDFAWKLPTYWDYVKSVLPVYTKLNQHKTNFLWWYDVEKAVKQDVFYADVIISCFIMVRRASYEEVGGFYERTFLYNEENIIAYRFHERRIKLAVLMKHPIVHLGCSSMNKASNNWEWKAKIMFDSSYIYLEDCLQVSKFALWFYTAAYKFGVWERKIFRKLRRKDG